MCAVSARTLLTPSKSVFMAVFPCDTCTIFEIDLSNRRVKRRCYFVHVIVAVYFAYFESLIVYRTQHVGHVMCLKRFITAASWSFKCTYDFMGMSATSLHRIYRLSNNS